MSALLTNNDKWVKQTTIKVYWFTAFAAGAPYNLFGDGLRLAEVRRRGRVVLGRVHWRAVLVHLVFSLHQTNHSPLRLIAPHVLQRR